MIRRMELRDFKALKPLFEELWPHRSFDREKARNIFRNYVKNKMYAIFCFKEKEILGIITVSLRKSFFYGGKVAIIEDLVVKKENRGQGIGKKLVKFVEKDLENDVLAWEVSSDLHRNHAHKFWDKRGYKRTGYHFRKIINSN